MNTLEQNLSLNKNFISELSDEAIALLKQLIAVPSFSNEEDETADVIQQFLETKGIRTFRKMNNVWAFNKL